MTLTQRQIVDKIEVLENNYIQVRTATVIEQNGIELTRAYHRRVLVYPYGDITNENPKVRAIANSISTLIQQS